MFALRLVGVALSVFILAYCVFSLTVSAGWKLTARLWRSQAPARSAGVLFALRLFPLVAAVAITGIYVVPSYLILEPAYIDEAVGPILVVVTCGALAWLLSAAFRVVAAQKRTSRVLSSWLRGANGISNGAPFPVLRLARHDPVLTVAGICAPRVLISETATSILARAELEVALRHEVAHIRNRDNLKKLLLRFAGFPGMRRLESAWLAMSEMAADDAAVSSLSEALDLASALIKLSRFAPVQRSQAVTSALVPEGRASLSARLGRLFNWAAPQSRKRSSYMLPSVATIAFLAVLTYGPMLSGVHVLTEWLVR